MELNNGLTDGSGNWSEQMSSWLKERSSQLSDNANDYIKYQIGNCDYMCCDKKIILTTNDGNKTQSCQSCNYIHSRRK